MRDRIRYREYEPDDRSGVRDLLLRTYGDTQSFDRFEHGNPLGEPLRVVAEADGRIVGFNHWNPWRIPSVEGEIVVHQSGASAVDPAMRGQGVFAKLLVEGEAAAERHGVSFFLGFPNPASFNSFLRAGWEHVASLDLRISLRPALGRSGAHREPEEEGLEPFWSWRYRAADVRRDVVRGGGGEPRYLFYRQDRIFGIPALRVLDVLTRSGSRPVAELPRLAAKLAGPRLVFYRTSGNASLSGPLSPTVPRSWSTPAILKRIHGDEAAARRLRNAVYLYGDIDAA